jgi:hypothetical protein
MRPFTSADVHKKTAGRIPFKKIADVIAGQLPKQWFSLSHRHLFRAISMNKYNANGFFEVFFRHRMSVQSN